LLWRIRPYRAPSSLVEDMMQETFLRVFRGLRGFDRSRARLSTWILTIAARLAVNELRRVWLDFEPLDAAAYQIGSGSRSDELTRRRAIGALLERELARLDANQRAVFLLREAHGFSYEEIGAALRLHPGTVKSGLARARTTLRAALEEYSDV
jgi:RNA polymerase sigma-70 factor (ECF subfamily)